MDLLSVHRSGPQSKSVSGLSPLECRSPRSSASRFGRRWGSSGAENRSHGVPLGPELAQGTKRALVELVGTLTTVAFVLHLGSCCRWLGCCCSSPSDPKHSTTMSSRATRVSCQRPQFAATLAWSKPRGLTTQLWCCRFYSAPRTSRWCPPRRSSDWFAPLSCWPASNAALVLHY